MRRALAFVAGLALCLTTIFAMAMTPSRIATQRPAPIFGVNVSGPEFAPWNGQTFPTVADFRYLQTLGVKHIRLPIAWESIQPTLSSTLDPTYLASLKTAIANAFAAGMDVQVDVHNFGHYCSQAHWTVSSGDCGYAGNAGTTVAATNFFGDGTLTTAVFADLWTRLSTALVGLPGVAAYGIMNEPVNITGTNLLFAPNAIGDAIGSQPWGQTNGTVVAQTAIPNPLGAGYGPVWSFTSGTGFGGPAQNVTVANVAYDLSCYAKTNSGTLPFGLLLSGGHAGSFTATTSWQRFDFSFTPTAGSQEIAPFLNTGSTGQVVNVANCQLATGSSPVTYQPNVYSAYAQAAITAIRVADTNAHISIDGNNLTIGCRWAFENWELNPTLLTGGGLIFDAHQYFDGNYSGANASGFTTSCGGGGTYSGTYTSYSTNASQGIQYLMPFVSWAKQNGIPPSQLVIGEYGYPVPGWHGYATTAGNANWSALAKNAQSYLRQANIPSFQWFYGANGIQANNNINMARSSGQSVPSMLQVVQQ